MATKVSFADAKSVPIESVLRHYGIKARRQGEFLVCRCPLPSHISEEPDTFKAHAKENWWKCWSKSCRAGRKEGGDVVDFVCEMEDVKPLAAAQKLSELFCLNQNAPRSAERDGCGAISKTNVLGHNKPLGFVLQANPEHEMIQSRGIRVATAKEWHVGYYENRQGTASMHQRIIFEIKEGNEVVGYVGRATKEGQQPKWLVGKGLHRGLVLYGVERCDRSMPVIVGESWWCPLWFYEHGQQAVALGGTELSTRQETLLEPFGTLIVALDSDEAGREASAKICERLRARHKIIRATLKE